MSFITIGNVTVNIEWAAFLLAFVLYTVVEKFINKKISGWFEDAVFTYIIVWKLSYIVFQFPLFIKNPLSVLYFSGGVFGHMLGVIVALILFIRKMKKNNEQIKWSQAFFTFASFYFVWQGCSFILEKQYVVGIVVMALYLFIVYRMRVNDSTVFVYLLMLLNSVLFAYDQQLFSIKGWVFIGVTLFVLSFLIQKEMKNVISFVVITCLITVAVFSFGQKKELAVESEEAVEFELQTLSGETVRLSDYEGKKVILNFWATWCPPCKAEMPHMQNFYAQYGEDVEIIAVNLMSRDNGINAVKEFVEANELTFPIPLDVDDVYGKKYEVKTIPTSYIINTKGEAIQKIVGPMDESMMKSLVKDIE